MMTTDEMCSVVSSASKRIAAQDAALRKAMEALKLADGELALKGFVPTGDLRKFIIQAHQAAKEVIG